MYTKCHYFIVPIPMESVPLHVHILMSNPCHIIQISFYSYGRGGGTCLVRRNFIFQIDRCLSIHRSFGGGPRRRVA